MQKFYKFKTFQWFTPILSWNLHNFIKEFSNRWSIDCNDLPHYDTLVKTEYVYVIDEDESEKLVDADDVSRDYKDEYGTPDIVGWVYEFDVEDICKQPTEYKELLDYLNDDEFVAKKDYVEIRVDLNIMQAKQKPTGDSLFDLF